MLRLPRLRRFAVTVALAAGAAFFCLGSKCATVERGAVDVKIDPVVDVEIDPQIAALAARIDKIETNLAVQIGGGVDSVTAMILAGGLVVCLFLSLTNLPYAIAQRWKPTRRLYDLCKGKRFGEP